MKFQSLVLPNNIAMFVFTVLNISSGCYAHEV
jgi:hypothetical protein